MSARASLAAAWLALVAGAAPVFADSTAPAPLPRSTPAGGTAEDELNRGLRATAAKDWLTAEAAFRRATQLARTSAEAWNGLGHALRQQGRYAPSLAAYDEALRLKPDFPEALEYVGEAYVKLGRMDDARRVLDRLRPLDAARAAELAKIIGAKP